MPLSPRARIIRSVVLSVYGTSERTLRLHGGRWVCTSYARACEACRPVSALLLCGSVPIALDAYLREAYRLSLALWGFRAPLSWSRHTTESGIWRQNWNGRSHYHRARKPSEATRSLVPSPRRPDLCRRRRRAPGDVSRAGATRRGGRPRGIHVPHLGRRFPRRRLIRDPGVHRHAGPRTGVFSCRRPVRAERPGRRTRGRRPRAGRGLGRGRVPG